MTTQKTSIQKVAFITDDRISHDRKTVFAKLISILKPKYNIEILPTSFAETDLLEHLEKNQYSLILLPWHKYFSWKKIDSHFGSLRLSGTTVAGYFADAILPFEMPPMPNFHRIVLLDFYRFEQNEIEMILNALVHQDQKSGFTGIFTKKTPIFFADWFSDDAMSTRCIDSVLAAPLLRSSHWSNRIQSLRFTLTSLWTLCFDSNHSNPSDVARAHLEMAEIDQKLAIKIAFESHDLSLKKMMDYLWPSGDRSNQAVREITRHADFLRIHQYPENHVIEITAFFTPKSPAFHYPGETRGFWIEPMKKKYLRTAQDENFSKFFSMNRSSDKRVADQLYEVMERLRAVHTQISTSRADERTGLEHQVSNIRFLIHEIEKKVAEKKKVA